MPTSPLHAPLLAWYDTNKRDLPWRARDVSGWEVLVSEVMLQQTPVMRVLPVYRAWISRWPVPAALAAEAPGEAIRMWERLGYPRRALRLHEAAVVIDERFGGIVPDDEQELRSLPGVGDYTAAAVVAFAYHRRSVVLDTNVRRVLARSVSGVERPPSAVTNAERVSALSVLPDRPEDAARWSVAVMELGALVCATSGPRCAGCPIADLCRWRTLGYPAHHGPPRRSQTYAGTDRQCRGRIMALLREAEDHITPDDVVLAWDDADQRERALASLLDDGLVVVGEAGTLRLP